MEIRPDLPEQDPEFPQRPADETPSGIAGSAPNGQIPPTGAGATASAPTAMDMRSRNAAGLFEAVPHAVTPASWWWLVSVLAVGLILGIGGLELFRMVARPLAMLVLAITIAAALAPLVERMAVRMPNTLAVIIVYLTLLLIIGGIMASMVPVLSGQVRMLITQSNVLFPQIMSYLARFGIDPTAVYNALFSEAGRISSTVLRLPLTVGSALTEFILIIFLSLYWLFLMPSIKAFFLSFFPTERKGFVSQTIALMGREMGGYLRGSAINGLIIGALTYVGLLIIGVPYALTIAALAGMMEFFPIIGPLVSGAAATLVALSVSPQMALITLLYFIALQQTEGHILVPLIMRSQTSVSPVLSIFAIVAGGAIGGLLGALIAIPIASVLSVLGRQVIAPAIRNANGVEAEEV